MSTYYHYFHHSNFSPISFSPCRKFTKFTHVEPTTSHSHSILTPPQNFTTTINTQPTNNKTHPPTHTPQKNHNVQLPTPTHQKITTIHQFDHTTPNHTTRSTTTTTTHIFTPPQKHYSSHITNFYLFFRPRESPLSKFQKLTTVELTSFLHSQKNHFFFPPGGRALSKKLHIHVDLPLFKNFTCHFFTYSIFPLSQILQKLHMSN
jgi:hypothetical protein